MPHEPLAFLLIDVLFGLPLLFLASPSAFLFVCAVVASFVFLRFLGLGPFLGILTAAMPL